MSALTREQIKAFRAADAAVFRFHLGADPKAIEETNALWLHKDVERPDGFGREVLRVKLDALALVNNFGHDRFPDDERDYSLPRASAGCWVVLSLRVHPEWQTIAGFLKPGDVLAQEWVIDNRNSLLKHADLTIHELKLRVHRPTKNGNTNVYTFLLDSRVEEARAITGHVTREAA